MNDLQFHKQLIADIFIAQITPGDTSNDFETKADYAAIGADVLIARMKKYFKRTDNESSEDIKHVPASIDYSKILKGFEEKWVVVDKNNHEPLGYGDTPEDALNNACRSFNDLNIVMTKVNRYGGRWTIETVDKP